MAGSREQGNAGSQVSGWVPLAVIGVVLVLFIRSCLSGGIIGREKWFPPPDREARTNDILTEPADGDGADSNGDNRLGDSLDSSDAADSEHSGSGDASAGGLPSTTLDPDILWEMMDPVEPECPEEDGSSPRYLQWTRPPPQCIDPARDYAATLITDLGNIVIDLDAETSPETVNRFVFLAGWHYYDGVEVHNAVRGELIEAGDPTGRPPGSGLGPGFPVSDNPLSYPTEQGEATRTDEQAATRSSTPGAGYPRHSVVMGSPWSAHPTPGVFFVVTAEESRLSPGPAPFGHVSRGQEVVDAIDETARRRDGPTHYSLPIEPSVIHRVTITET